MANEHNHHLCPMGHARTLRNPLRRWVHHPQKILGPYVAAGMTVLDMGCGPGYFTLPLAEMVGVGGRVIAADVQDGMLEIIRDRVRETSLEERVTLHKCAADRAGLPAGIDFALAFYALHEHPDPAAFFAELAAAFNPGGRILLVEPKYLHVSRDDFARMTAAAHACGLRPVARPRVMFSQAVLLAGA